MKTLLITFVVLSVCCSACNGNDKHRLDIDASESATNQAERLTSVYSPQESAKILIDWMLQAQSADREFARSLAAGIVSNYSIEEADRFTRAVDSLSSTFEAPDQAHLFVVATPPAKLAYMVKNEPNSAELINLIESEYAGDTISLRLFREIINE